MPAYNLPLASNQFYHIFFSLLVLLATLICSTVSASNLLSNSDFKLGKPGDTDFAWKMDLAQDQKSECSVVQGHRAGVTAVRIYNDELGASFLIQDVKVQPWRWYVADVWVNSEGMAAFDFAPSISLTGGRTVSGGNFHNDAFERPKKGWRCLSVIAHSADKNVLTFKMGGGGVSGRGGGWSGEILFSEPIIRECSIVEAAKRYPSVSERDPRSYALPPNPANNQQGYVFQRGDVCRVAPGFPNSLFIIGQVNKDAQEGRVSVVLPPGIRLLKHQNKAIVPIVSDMPKGFQRVELPPAPAELVVSSDLKPGEEAVGYVQLEWNGGMQVPTPVHFRGINFPKITAPKRAMVMLDISGATKGFWNDNETTMVRDFKRFGFNTLEIWGGDPRGVHKNGVDGVTVFGGGFYVKEKYPEALAVSLDGNPVDEELISPSYRGPGLQAQIDRVKSYAPYSSALTLDDENYGCSAGSPTICFHPRTIERWNEWVTKNAPDLAGIDPKVFSKQPHKYRKHYDAWLQFRGDLVAEMYAILKDEWYKAVKVSGIKTTKRPMLGAYVAESPLVGLHLCKSLAPVLDYLAAMVYDDGAGVRKEVAQLAPVAGKKLVVAISPGYQNSPPGDTRSQVLEALMGGSQGIIAWGYFMGMDTGHLADIADAIRMFNQVEDIVLDGKLQDGYTCNSMLVNLSVRKLGSDSVLLVSDYSHTPGKVTVVVPGRQPVTVKDLDTGKQIAKLSATQRQFKVELTRDYNARLYHIQPIK